MIKVLIIDDSAVVRKTLSKALAEFPDIEVVGTAVDPYVARERIATCKPDVLTLDIEMPRMDGLTFLGKLMRFHPIPTIMVSSLTAKNSEMTMRAMAMGAVSVVPKPGSQFSVPDVKNALVQAIRAAAVAKVMPRKASASLDPPRDLGIETSHKVLAIGASTGGTAAIEVVMRTLPRDAPGTVIAQHMPAGFTKSFAERLNRLCAMEVREAMEGDDVVPGVALIAPGGFHMVMKRNGARYYVSMNQEPPQHHQRPAVDPLFETVARCATTNAVGIILTGMGTDGASGLVTMRKEGAHTIAQDEKSCVVFGMPKEAIAKGGAEEVLTLNAIGPAILKSRILRGSKATV